MADELVRIIGDEVSRAEATFSGMRAKALTIVGMSGGIVALTTGFLALAGVKGGRDINLLARIVILLAFLAFVAAAVFALLVNLPSDVTSAKPADLTTLINENWEDDWAKSAARFQVKYLESLQTVNEAVAKNFTNAVRAEVAGVGLVALLALVLVFFPSG